MTQMGPHDRLRLRCPGRVGRLALAGTVALLPACSPVDPAPPVIHVAGPVALVQALNRARWEPDLVNLNNPAIDRGRADLGDGPVPVLLCHPVASVTWRLELAATVRLKTGIGLLPDAWPRSGDGAGFRVVLDDGRRRTLFHAHLDPRRRAADRRWIPVDIDLSPWAGQVVLLTLATDPGPAADPTWDWAVWRDPTLVPGSPS